jgi:uncharacterized membrane protein
MSKKSVNWYFAVVILTLANTIVVFAIQDNSPYSVIRYVLGFISLLGLPGYSLVRILFPVASSSKENVRVDDLMRFAFSVVFSIAIVSIVGFALDYALSVTLESLVFCLSSITIIFATTAVVRENRKRIEMRS